MDKSEKNLGKIDKATNWPSPVALTQLALAITSQTPSLPSNSLLPFLGLPRFFFDSEKEFKVLESPKAGEAGVRCLRLSSSEVSGVKLSAGAAFGALLLELLLVLGELPRDLPFLLVSRVSLMTILALLFRLSVAY